MRETLTRNGLQCPMNYYRVSLENKNLADQQGTSTALVVVFSRILL